MSEENTENKEKIQAMPEGGNMPITIHGQYVKDLSFENPNTPDSLRPDAGAPEMDVNIGMDARKIEDPSIANMYEVVLNVRASALSPKDKSVVFIGELQYGVAVSLNDVPEDQHHPFLLIEIPRLAFPYARQILSDLTVQGGFPPLLLNPVDFHALYMDRFKDEIRQAQAEAEQAKAGNASS